MAFWDGERWTSEANDDRTSRHRGRWSRGGLAVAVLLAAIVLATEAGAPVSIDGMGRSASSDGRQGAPTEPRGSVESAGAQGPATPGSTSGHVKGKPGPATANAPSLLTASTLAAAAPKIAVPPPTPVLPSSGTPVYLHYYLWWTKRHWQEKLGSSYPYTADPLPLPGQTDAVGCSPTVSYVGATIVDIPSDGLADQSLAATFDFDVRTAVAHGITGFVADWAGTGAAIQAPSSSGYDARLDLLVQRVDAWNATHAQKFRLALDFAAFGQYSRPASAIVNDLAYFTGRYGGDPAFASAFSSRPLVMMIGSRKYSLATMQAVSAAARPALFLLGDETYSSLARDAAYLDGSSYYWSSESPSNSGARQQIASLGTQLHAAGKPWFAPFTAGYDSVLIGGHCVPRNGLSTLETIWSWNAGSNPDAWFGISWNEYVENTYLEPSLKYGDAYLAEVARLSGH